MEINKCYELVLNKLRIGDYQVGVMSGRSNPTPEEIVSLDHETHTLNYLLFEAMRKNKDLRWKDFHFILVPNNIGCDINFTLLEVESFKNNLVKMYKINNLYHTECVSGMKLLSDNFVDLTVTSPPYDNLRDYNGYTMDLHAIGQELYRITKPGGIVAMVIQDQTKDFGKSLTSFRTIVDWCDSFGFKLFETVIYQKNGSEGGWWSKRFRVDHEYMAIFLKGDRPQYFNKEGLKIPSIHAGKTMKGGASRKKDGTTCESQTMVINPMKCRGTIWNYANGGDKNRIKQQHPAAYPDKIPYDFIQCFCPPDGLVFDPMIGSGSSGVAAKVLGRNYLGFDISEEYLEIARTRIRDLETNLTKL